MAEAPRNPLPSGYDEDFVNAFEEDFQCLICHLAQKEPVQTRCGHRFCKECLEEHFRRQVGEPSTCPADWRTLNRDQDIFPDKATERKILSLIIRCPNDDCEWTGELRYKETHLASCPFRDVPCTNENCQVKLKWKDLFEHVTATCQWGIILCEHCSERHPKCQMEVHIREKCKLRPLSCPYKCGALNLRDKELQDHLETCQRFPVRCPNNCEAVIFREMVSNHIKDYCPLTKIPCPYAWMGCRTEVHRDQLESHIQCATKSHLDLACGELRDTHEKLKEKIIHFDRLEERVNILHEQLEEKVNDIQHQHQNNVDFLQRQHQLRVGVLQEQLEQNVKTCHMERKIFLVCLVLGLVFITFYLTKLDRVQKNVEEQLSVIQSLYERNVHIVKKDLEDRFQKELEEKVTVMKNLEDRVQTKLEEKVSVIQSLHERNVRMVKKDLEDRFQKELEEKVTVMKNLEDRFQTKLEEKVSVIQSLHEKNVILEVDPEVSHTFIWKITNYEDKLRQVKNNGKRKIESVPFYANGYNLMLRLWPNGYGVGTNTHLSISIVVMKGEYDAILPWGFSKQVTFTLMDQQDNPNQRQNVVMAFTTDPNNAVFTKPVEGKTRFGWGHPEFVSHNGLRTRRFIVDDILFVKCQVDSPKAKTSRL